MLTSAQAAGHHRDMTLREYLAATDQTPSAFALQIGRTRSTVYRWLAEDFVPQWSVMREIEIITGGAVTPNDWRKVA